jgi:hypothetical protein
LLFGKEEALSWNKDELARMMMLGIARKQQKNEVAWTKKTKGSKARVLRHEVKVMLEAWATCANLV